MHTYACNFTSTHIHGHLLKRESFMYNVLSEKSPNPFSEGITENATIPSDVVFELSVSIFVKACSAMHFVWIGAFLVFFL